MAKEVFGIYACFLCDEWKSRNSMRLDMIATEQKAVEKWLIKLLKEQAIEFDGCEKLEEALKAFRDTLLEKRL